MSLVDYASSSDDEQIVVGGGGGGEGKKEEQQRKPDEPNRVMLPSPDSQNRNFMASRHQNSCSVSAVSLLPPPSLERLPDASVLLGSPSISSHQIAGSDHASRVITAMAKSASRKRESNESSLSCPHNKYPRGHLPHSRNVPNTTGGLLIPPQISGRSNVATEDISKLFVSRQPPESSR